jgi:hypothetical protein
MRLARQLAHQQPLHARRGIRLDGLERGGRHFPETFREELDRRERLAELGAQADGRGVQRLQHLALSMRARLLRHEDRAAASLQCLQADHVLVAESEDGAGDCRLRAGALADLERDLARDRSGLLAHVAQHREDPAIGEDLEVRRLREVKEQRLADRAVEDRVAGAVLDFGDEDGVALGDGK